MRSLLWIILSIALALPFTLFSYLSHLAANMNSDLLGLSDIYEGLVKRGEAWSSFKISGSSFLVPDLLLIFPLSWILNDSYLAYLVLTGLLVTVTWVSLLLLGKFLVGKSMRRGAAWVLVLLLCITHPALLPPWAAFWGGLYHPACHGGAYTLVLLGMVVLLQQITRHHPLNLVWLVLLAAAGGSSDLLFLLYFTLPSLAVLAVHAWLCPHGRTRTAVTASAIIGGWLLGRVILRLVMVSGTHEQAYIKHTGPLTAWNNLVFMVGDLWRRMDAPFLISVFLGALAATYLVIHLLRTAKRGTLAGPRSGLPVIFALTAYVGGWAGLWATGNYVDLGSWRYIVLPHTLVIFTFAWTLVPRLPLWTGRTGWLVVAALIVAGGFQLPRLDRPYTPLAQAVDAYASNHKTVALSEYWTARRTTFLSRQGVRFEQICDDGKIYHWTNSLDPYRRMRSGDGWHVLVVMEGLKPEKIVSAYGSPADVREMGGQQVYLYPPPNSDRILDALRQNASR